MDKLLKLGAGILLSALVGCASTNQKPSNNTVSMVGVGIESEVLGLLQKAQWDEANKKLTNYVATMPSNWQPRQMVNGRMQIRYWDQDYLAKCMVVDAVAFDKIPVDAYAGGSYAQAYYYLAYVALEQRNAAKAYEYLNKSLALEPNAPIAQAELGTFYQMTKEPEMAVKTFSQLVNSSTCMIDRDRGKAYRGLGVSLIDLGRLDEAEVAFNNSLKFSPNNKVALGELRYIDKLRNGGAKQPLSDKLEKTQ